jgi:hypothetical protein
VGYAATWVHGLAVVRDDVLTPERPGRLVRQGGAAGRA